MAGTMKLWARRDNHGNLAISEFSDNISLSNYIGPILVPEHLYHHWCRVRDIAEGVVQSVESHQNN